MHLLLQLPPPTLRCYCCCCCRRSDTPPFIDRPSQTAPSGERGPNRIRRRRPGEWTEKLIAAETDADVQIFRVRNSRHCEQPFRQVLVGGDSAVACAVTEWPNAHRSPLGPDDRAVTSSNSRAFCSATDQCDTSDSAADRRGPRKPRGRWSQSPAAAASGWTNTAACIREVTGKLMSSHRRRGRQCWRR